MRPCQLHRLQWPPTSPNAPKRSSRRPCAWSPRPSATSTARTACPTRSTQTASRSCWPVSPARARPGAQKQAKGISREDLAAIRATACSPRVGRGGRIESKAQARGRGQTDIALCAVMFDCMLRRSEAAVLTWADIVREADGSGRLTVRRSKTDPEGEGKVLWVSPDTMAALDAIRRERDGDTVFGLSGQQISRRIAAACEAAGLGRGYSGHSLRVGAAQALAGANISLAAIMENGRWQSSRMPARYTRNAAAAQSAMAKLYGQNGH